MTTESSTCPVSGDPLEMIFQETVLQKYPVRYYYCSRCGLVKTEKPYWLDEAYSAAICDSDTGIIQRNQANCANLTVLLEQLSLRNGRLLDLAGGYGLLTRMMRDKGFDCYTTDKYCSNLFARAFEPDADFKADALFAFEVLEHLDDPVLFLEEAFRRYCCKTVIFSTLTFENAVPPRDWWYYAFDEGQHISFYQTRTLKHLADRLGCEYYRIDSSMHIISERNISPAALLPCRNRYLRKIYSLYLEQRRKRFSRTWADREKIKNTRQPGRP